jgi:hypothetical protein
MTRTIAGGLSGMGVGRKCGIGMFITVCSRRLGDLADEILCREFPEKTKSAQSVTQPVEASDAWPTRGPEIYREWQLTAELVQGRERRGREDGSAAWRPTVRDQLQALAVTLLRSGDELQEMLGYIHRCGNRTESARMAAGLRAKRPRRRRSSVGARAYAASVWPHRARR